MIPGILGSILRAFWQHCMIHLDPTQTIVSKTIYGARIIRTKIHEKFVRVEQCANYPHIQVGGVHGEAYNCANYPVVTLSAILQSLRSKMSNISV